MDDFLWILKRSASFVAVQATEALASSRAVLLCSADSVSLGAYGAYGMEANLRWVKVARGSRANVAPTQPENGQKNLLLGDGFKIFFIFTITWGNDQI